MKTIQINQWSLRKKGIDETRDLNKYLKMKTRNQISLLIIILLLFVSLSVFSQDTDFFNSDVETVQNPWTNLDFYNDPSNFQFALVSDNTGGARPGIFELAVEKLNLMMPEFVLSVGDLIEGYTRDTTRIFAEWDDFNAKVEKLKMPFFYLPGNHDITNSVMQKEWEERYGRRYYYFTYKDVLFLILDSEDDKDNYFSETQTSFALDALKSNPNVRWTFVLMHQPVWKYHARDRFEKIEDALKNRKHTVIAGHEHQYQYIERKETNYYVLGTTGGGSALRGNRFGEFDHIAWVTMTESGPVMANLRLDGILSHDISNATTEKMAQAMLANTNLRYLVMTNQGDNFKDGTAYLHFNNSAEVALNVDLSFFHHHQVEILPSKKKVKLLPGEQIVIEISLEANESISFEKLGFLQYYWKLSYEGEEYKDFYLDGNADFSIAPSTPDFLKPQTPQFAGNAEITFNHSFEQLKTELKINGVKSDMGFLPGKLQLNESTNLEIILRNGKNQSTVPQIKSYEKIPYLKGKRVKKTVPGLSYSYYEGNWSDIPDFNQQKPVKEGIVNSLKIEDITDKLNNYAIRFTGYIEIPEEGMYYFRIRARDSASLKIHGNLICFEFFYNPNIKQRDKDSIGVIALSKGMHPFEIDYFNNQGKGKEELHVLYKMSEEKDIPFHPIHPDILFRTTNR